MKESWNFGTGSRSPVISSSQACFTMRRTRWSRLFRLISCDGWDWPVTIRAIKRKALVLGPSFRKYQVGYHWISSCVIIGSFKVKKIKRSRSSRVFIRVRTPLDLELAQFSDTPNEWTRCSLGPGRLPLEETVLAFYKWAFGAHITLPLTEIQPQLIGRNTRWPSGYAGLT